MQGLETGLLEQSEYFFHTPTSLEKSLLFTWKSADIFTPIRIIK